MKEIKLNIGELVLLEALRRQNDQYGFQLQKVVEEILQSKRSLGGVYTTLHRLETKKFVIPKWEDGRNSGGGRRRFYKLTQEGKKVCDEMREVLGRILAG